MRALSPLALCLLLAAGPALAGNDFCDGVGSLISDPSLPGVPPVYNGGSCEVNMIVTPQVQSGSTAYWRMRDLPYTRDNIDALQSFEGWPELPMCLEEAHLPWGDASKLAMDGVIDPPIGEPGGPYNESTFLEWSFQPGGIESGARVLTLSVLVDGRATYLRADWLNPPRRGWSYADIGGDANPPQTLGSRMVRLYASGQPSPQRFTLLHDGAFVRVGLGYPVRDWISFPLPNERWHPTRLRNGLVKGTPLSEGLGLRVAWPNVKPGTLNRDRPDAASEEPQPQPQPQPDPTTPRLD